MNNNKTENKRKRTQEEFVSCVFDLVGSEYVVVGKYINSQTKIDFLHTKCNKTFSSIPNNFLRGSRCPHCAGNKHKNIEIFKQEAFTLVGDEYDVVSEYLNAYTKIKLFHKKCSTEYEVTPHNFLRGRRCPFCSGLYQLNNEEFLMRVESLIGSKYTFYDRYVNSKTKLRVIHNECGKVYSVSPANFFKGRRCPKCKLKTSIGEKLISDYLKRNEISYSTQFELDDCKYVKLLPFDFAILSEGGELDILIEFDGEQHYKSIPYFGGEEGLRVRKLRDQIKNEYCIKNNIPLVRIAHPQISQIEDILDGIFSSKIRTALESNIIGW